MKIKLDENIPQRVAPPEPPPRRVPKWVPNLLVLAGLGRTDWTVTWTIPCSPDRVGLSGLKTPGS